MQEACHFDRLVRRKYEQAAPKDDCAIKPGTSPGPVRRCPLFGARGFGECTVASIIRQGHSTDTPTHTHTVREKGEGKNHPHRVGRLWPGGFSFFAFVVWCGRALNNNNNNKKRRFCLFRAHRCLQKQISNGAVVTTT